jgi:hypothetical protein
LRVMFESPTVAALAEWIIQREIEMATDETLAEVLAELEDSSHEDAQSILAAKGDYEAEETSNE